MSDAYGMLILHSVTGVFGFSADPIRYVPQFGGHCTDGVSYGYAATIIDPNAWRIIDDKLYLFHSKEVMASFLEKPGRLKRAENKWPSVKEKIKD